MSAPRITVSVFALDQLLLPKAAGAKGWSARLAEATTDEDLIFDIAETPGSRIDRLHTAVRAVTAGRALVPPPADPADDDVVDPYRRAPEVFELSTQQLVPAVDATAEFLRRALEVPV